MHLTRREMGEEVSSPGKDWGVSGLNCRVQGLQMTCMQWSGPNLLTHVLQDHNQARFAMFYLPK
jgi:hypothetical protein